MTYPVAPKSKDKRHRARRRANQHLRAIQDRGGKVFAIHETTTVTQEPSGPRLRRGLRFTNGSLRELLEISCAFALATCAAMKDYYTADVRVHNVVALHCQIVCNGRIITAGPEVRMGEAIARWFELSEATELARIHFLFLNRPSSRAIFAARNAIVEFFQDKGLSVPPGSPDWLVTGTKGGPVIGIS